MNARILVIDDEPRWLNFAERDLGAIFEVEVATDLETILAKLEDNRYDLIIASARYDDILKIISERYPKKRVVVATGQATTREAISMYRLGALDYFVKDFRPEIVSDRLLKTYHNAVFPQAAPKAV